MENLPILYFSFGVERGKLVKSKEKLNRNEEILNSKHFRGSSGAILAARLVLTHVVMRCRVDLLLHVLTRRFGSFLKLLCHIGMDCCCVEILHWKQNAQNVVEAENLRERISLLP